MKKLALFIILSSLLFHNGVSQEKNPNMENMVNFKIMPISLLAYNPRHRIGLEYISKNRWGYSIDIGKGDKSFNQRRLNGLKWGNDYSFFEIRPEVKYLLKIDKEYFFYTALEFFHIEMSDLLESGEYQKEDATIGTSYESARFTKQKTGTHIKGGVNFIALKRLNFDFYGGLGIANRSITYTDVVNPVDNRSIFIEWIPQPDLFEGESIILHFTLGFKIGYTLWRK